MGISTLIRTIVLTCLTGMVSIKTLLGGPDNIAPLAIATASSSISSDYDAFKVTDGVIHVSNKENGLRRVR